MTPGYIFEQLLTELPSIVVCISAIVLALTFRRRAPSASIFVILACGLTLLLLLLHPFAWQVARRMFDGDPRMARRINVAFAFFWSMVRAISTGLLVAAAYAGRGRQ
jgi:hypothetical protein